MCAEGGTGYGHSVTVARSDFVLGPYESDPCNPVLTSTGDFYGRDDDWFLKTQCYNPDSILQKSGHGSLVGTADGQWYLAHLCARPFLPELRCTLGRETALQKMYWTDDGWLRLSGGGNRAKTETEESGLPEWKAPEEKEREDFDGEWNPSLVSPRTDWKGWSSTTVRPGFLRLYGQQSLCSLDRVSLVARRLTSLAADAGTSVEFESYTWQQSAGLVVYYDNMNWVYLRLYRSDTLGSKAIALMRVENGEKRELPETRVALPPNVPVYMKCSGRGRSLSFYWSLEVPGPVNAQFAAALSVFTGALNSPVHRFRTANGRR
jgi:xylan 1,4-beta-xylosidase